MFLYKKKVILFFILTLGGFWFLVIDGEKRESAGDFSGEKMIIINDDGFRYTVKTQSPTIKSFIQENNLNIQESDVLFPERENELLPGTTLHIERAKTFTLKTKDGIQEHTSTARTAREFLDEQKITLGENDFLEPGDIPLFDGVQLALIEVEVKETKEYESIDYKTIETTSDEFGWREKKTLQKGEEGELELVYKEIYHNGERVDRTLMHKTVIKEPVSKKIVQGTYVDLGKKHTGAASWYRHTGTMAAANPWLPKGSYVKVTNKANGKSVIVVINDRGPFVPGRIIDLDAVAFEQIASLGAGVIDIVMEEVEN